MSKSNKSLGKPLKKYRAVSWPLFISSVVVLGCLLMIFIWLLIKAPDSWGVLVSILVIILTLLVAAVSHFNYKYIAIYPEGFEYRSFSVSLYTSWQNVHGIFRTRRPDPNHRGEVTIYYHIVLKRSVGGIKRLELQPIINMQAYYSKGGLDRERFVRRRFGKDLAHYAPHFLY